MAKSRDLADSAVIINFLDNTTSNVQNQIDSKQTYDANLTSFVTAFTLPTSDGSNGQVLSTDGLGNISFADVAASYGDIDVGTYLTNNGYDTSVNIISAITDAAPVTLNTLNELAAALGDDANFAGTVTTSLAAKANTADLAAVATTGAYADITGTPILAAVATTGSYASLTGTPDLSSYATQTYVTTAVSNLVDTAPAALDTLNELAAALGDDANFAGTVTTSLAAKANTADLAAVATTGAYADITGTPDLSSYATQTYVTTAVSNLVDTAPAALDTLNELAAALGDDANFAGTVTTSLAAKANTADLAAVATSGSYNDLTDTPTSSGGVSTGKAIAMAMIFGG